MSGYFNLGKNLYKGFQKVFDASRSSSTPKNLRGTMSTTIVGVKPNVPTTKLEKAKSKLAIAKQKAKTSALKLKNTLSDLKEKVTKREKKMGGGMMGRKELNKGGGADYINTVKAKKRGNPAVVTKTREKRMGGGMMGRRMVYSQGSNGLVGKQKNIDVAAPFGKITGDDFKKLRKK